jgi:hypothetical protein
LKFQMDMPKDDMVCHSILGKEFQVCLSF